MDNVVFVEVQCKSEQESLRNKELKAVEHCWTSYLSRLTRKGPWPNLAQSWETASQNQHDA